MLNIERKGGSLIAVVLATLLPVLALFFTITDASDLAASDLPTAVVSHAAPPYSPDTVSEDVLWLARCAFSETKQPHEQELVAWVLRNRVETQYRRQNTYKNVVLDPYQFSAFNPNSPKRRLYMNLTPHSDLPGWQRTLRIAHEVYHEPASKRPFPRRTRHFYSERSMVGRQAPNWSEGKTPVQPVGFRVDPRRFRFYSGVASSLLL